MSDADKWKVTNDQMRDFINEHCADEELRDELLEAYDKWDDEDEQERQEYVDKLPHTD
jgi:hypothetical protein